MSIHVCGFESLLNVGRLNIGEMVIEKDTEKVRLERFCQLESQLKKCPARHICGFLASLTTCAVAQISNWTQKTTKTKQNRTETKAKPSYSIEDLNKTKLTLKALKPPLK